MFLVFYVITILKPLLVSLWNLQGAAIHLSEESVIEF